MPSYEVVEHSVEGNGDRHFFRVAVWRKGRSPLPDLYAEFLLHPGGEDDPMGPIIRIIEQRVRDIGADETILDDAFNSKELAQFKLRVAHKSHPVEAHIRQHAKGTKGML